MKEEPLHLQPLTGLTDGQLLELVSRVHAITGPIAKPGGRAAKPGLYRSVAMVVALMRRNFVQEVAGAIFGCSQSTVSRRWDRLRPAIAEALAAFVPDPAEIVGADGTCLVDGTICPTWDWDAIPDLYSGKAHYAGINVQIGCNLDGDVAAIGVNPVHGARHDAHAYEASGLKDVIADLFNRAADTGYIGVDGIDIVPFRKPAGQELTDGQKASNRDFSAIRAAVERAVASVKRWRMLSEEGGNYRCPISKYGEVLAAIRGLYFFAAYIDA